MKERIKCPHCEKDYASQENLDKHILEKHSDKTMPVEDEQHTSDTMVSKEKDNQNGGKKNDYAEYNYENISKRFKMTGGFSSKDIDNINKLYTIFTGIKVEPTSCKNQMIYRCQVVASNFYKK
jgi:hypothetical protein